MHAESIRRFSPNITKWSYILLSFVIPSLTISIFALTLATSAISSAARPAQVLLLYVLVIEVIGSVWTLIYIRPKYKDLYSKWLKTDAKWDEIERLKNILWPLDGKGIQEYTLSEIEDKIAEVDNDNTIELQDKMKAQVLLKMLKRLQEGDYLSNCGPKRVGTYLNLNTDTYACAFAYQFHRYYLEDECSEEEEILQLYPNEFANS